MATCTITNEQCVAGSVAGKPECKNPTTCPHRDFPVGCQYNCRGDYDNGGFGCPNAAICSKFGSF